MPDQILPEDANIDEVDATGQPLGLGQVDAPQQVPMSDDAGGPSVGSDTDDRDEAKTSIDDLSVQGGE